VGRNFVKNSFRPLSKNAEESGDVDADKWKDCIDGHELVKEREGESLLSSTSGEAHQVGYQMLRFCNGVLWTTPFTSDVGLARDASALPTFISCVRL
jgi:hypothetical protein